MKYKFTIIAVLLIIMIMHPSMVISASPNSQERIAAIKKILNKHILDTGVDIKQIFQEVSEQMPLDPVETPEYMNWKKKKEEIVKKRFSMTDRQLREVLSKKAEKHHPLHKIGDTVTINYLLARKLYNITGTYYRKTDRFIYIGSSKILRRNIPEEFACQFDEFKTTYLREKYIKNGIQSYHKKKKDFEDQIFKNEIMQSQGYLIYDRQWMTARNIIHKEIEKLAEKKGVTAKQLISGILPDTAADLPAPDGVKFNQAGTILLKYPTNAPNRFYKVPNSVKTIGSKAFKDCENLEQVFLPDGIQTISNSAFANCKKLAMVNLPDSIEEIGSFAFNDCASLKTVIIPKKVTTIPEYCFCLSGLESIIIHDDIVKIGQCAFAKTKLQKIILPANVKFIDGGAFQGNKLKIVSHNPIFKTDKYGGLSDVNKKVLLYVPADIEKYVIPDNTIEIGSFAFSMSSLKKIRIPNSVKVINDYAFANCQKIQSVLFSDQISSIGANAFSNCGVREVRLPEMVNSIGQGAFSYCNNLKEIYFPKRVTTLPWAICANCTNLIKVSVSPYLKEIKGRAFWDCKQLTDINIPRYIIVAKGAFAGSPLKEKIENLTEGMFQLPTFPAVFNWDFTIDDYRGQKYHPRLTGKSSNILEYRLFSRYSFFDCLTFDNKPTPFCFIISGQHAVRITAAIIQDQKNLARQYDYVKIKTFDCEDFEVRKPKYIGIVFLSKQHKLLIHIDYRDNHKIVVYNIDDQQDDIYYKMLHAGSDSTAAAAPSEIPLSSHPIVKEIVNIMLNKPDNMEKKIADAVDRFKVENGKPSYEKANKYLGETLAYHARSKTPAGVSKREYFTNTVIAYLQQ